MQRWFVALAFAIAAAATAGEVPGTASGTFRSQGMLMEVKSAIAFRSKSTFDKQDAIVVAITNARMTDAIADYYDRRRALDKRLVDERTGVVYLEFRTDGRYRGLSYYFASGNGCAFCSGDVMSSVKLANGKLAGSLQSNEPQRTMNVTIDVPVLSDEHGTPLAGDGGAPGAAYRAYHTALLKRDAKALKPLLSAELRGIMTESEKKKDVDGFLRWLARDHPTKSVRIAKGYANGDKAVLAVAGESSTSKVVGEVVLVKEEGTWRVDDEFTEVALE
jgi:hypothetical protein